MAVITIEEETLIVDQMAMPMFDIIRHKYWPVLSGLP